MPRVVNGQLDEQPDEIVLDRPLIYHARSPWLAKMYSSRSSQRNWRCVGPEPMNLLSLDSFDVNVLGLIRTDLTLNDNKFGVLSAIFTTLTLTLHINYRIMP